MSKIGDELIEAMGEALAFAEGTADPKGYRVHAPKTVDVRAIRHKLGLSQDAFAQRFGFSVASIRNWEQGIRCPEGPARVLLIVIDRDPGAVERALSAA